jgi:hypothetical protein
LEAPTRAERVGRSDFSTGWIVCFEVAIFAVIFFCVKSWVVIELISGDE